MYTAFLDESFDDRNEGIFAVAAVLGEEAEIKEGVHRWSALLARERIPVFKFSKLRRASKLMEEFASVICDSGLLACGIISEQATVIAGLRGSALHRQYRQSPFMLMYQQTFVNIAMDFRRAGSTERVSFVCDENARYARLMKSSFQHLKAENPLSAPHFGPLSMETDQNCVPLQMADLIAGNLRVQGNNWDDEHSLSPALKILTRRAMWSIRHFDEESVKFTRQLVDERTRR